MIVYNEIEPYAARWLENLSNKNLINPGRVDTRSIADVTSQEVAGATQFHTFAGIGVWSYALRLAGWPDDLPVWTGSCPCQPFSQAGKREGFSDSRHLWPEWFRLIRECRPPVVFGEQVASKDGLNWLDAVQTDMEGAGYAFAAFDLCSPGVGAPHIRQRLYFVGVANTDGEFGGQRRPFVGGCDQGGDAESRAGSGSGGRAGWLALAPGVRLEGRLPEPDGAIRIRATDLHSDGGAVGGFWSGADWLYCRDEKLRPVEPGTFPLAHGAPGRVGRIRAYGNAIVAPLAATFIRSVMEVL